MTQTTNGMSFRNAKIETSPDGSAWTDISGFANSVSVDGGERATAEFYTADGDTPFITEGKRAPKEVTCKCAYTEPGPDPYNTVATAYENDSPLYLRWSPKGGGSGTNRFTTSKGIVTKCPYPMGEVSSPDAVAFEFTIKVGEIVRSVIA